MHAMPESLRYDESKLRRCHISIKVTIYTVPESPTSLSRVQATSVSHNTVLDSGGRRNKLVRVQGLESEILGVAMDGHGPDSVAQKTSRSLHAGQGRYASVIDTVNPSAGHAKAHHSAMMTPS